MVMKATLSGWALTYMAVIIVLIIVIVTLGAYMAYVREYAEPLDEGVKNLLLYGGAGLSLFIGASWVMWVAMSSESMITLTVGEKPEKKSEEKLEVEQ